MKKKLSEYTWSQFLDKNKKFKIYSRYILNDKFTNITEFAIILIYVKEKEIFEILRYDGSLKEWVNVHKFYLGTNEKVYLIKPVSWETLEHFIQDIQKNWRIYFSKYKEKYSYNFWRYI